MPDNYRHDRDRIKNRDDVTIPLGEYYFIDHTGCVLDIEQNKLAADNFAKYVDKVSLLHDQMIQFMRKELPCP